MNVFFRLAMTQSTTLRIRASVFIFVVGTNIAGFAIIGAGEESGDSGDGVVMFIGFAFQKIERFFEGSGYALIASAKLNKLGSVQINNGNVAANVLGNNGHGVKSSLLRFGLFFQRNGEFSLQPTPVAANSFVLFLRTVAVGFVGGVRHNSLLLLVSDAHHERAPHAPTEKKTHKNK